MHAPAATNPPSAAVIGAGPAGCAAAITLARADWSVDLYEAKPFPRIKVCGEFVSPAAAGVLESLIPPEALRRAGAARVGSFTLALPDGRSRTRALPAPGWALSRAALDDALLQRARSAGVRILQPVAVRDVDIEDDAVRVDLVRGDPIDADVVVHADNAGRFDRRRGMPAPRPAAPGLVGLKCHFRPPAPIEGVHIRAARGGYIGLISVERGLATCALVTRAAIVKAHAGDHDAVVRSLWGEPSDSRRDPCPVTPDRREGEWMASGVPRSSYITPESWRSFRVGNAAAAVDPVGGEGIGLALWSGDALGRALGAAPRWNGTTLRRLQRDHARRYLARLRFRRPGCYLASACVSRPGLVRTVWPLLALGPAPWWAWFAATGKPLTRNPA